MGRILGECKEQGNVQINSRLGVEKIKYLFINFKSNQDLFLAVRLKQYRAINISATFINRAVKIGS